MLYLFISIILTSFTYIIFRAFTKYGIDPLPAIVFNYVGRVIFGLVLDHKGFIAYVTNAPAPLLLLCAGTGILFIMIFSLVSKATRTLGVTSTTIISRMSMVIPAAFSILYYHDTLGAVKIAGILLAILAIYFTVYVKPSVSMAAVPGKKSGGDLTDENPASAKKTPKMMLPVILFLGTGLADTLIKIAQTRYMSVHIDYVYIDIIYTVSALAGIAALIYNKVSPRIVFKPSNVGWGLLLGIVNYVSFLLFLLALTMGKLQGSDVFPINSVGIVLSSTIFAVILFKEKINPHKVIGLVLAIVSIVLISGGWVHIVNWLG